MTFSALGGQQASINTLGQVAFRGNPSSAGTPQGVWIHGSGMNTNIAIAGGAMPGGGTYTSGTNSIFNTTHVNNSGDWAFRLGASTGLFGSVAGTPTRVMLAGDVAPGTGDATYASSASGMPLFNDAGVTGYIANLTANTGSPPVVISGANANAQGLWTGLPGSSSLVLRQNDPVLSLDGGGNVRVGTFQTGSLSMNGAGRFVVNSNLQGTVVSGSGAGSNSVMISSNRSGALEVIARHGNPAPDIAGVPSAVDLFRALGTGAIAFNDNGRVGFTSSLRDAAGVQTSTSALFTDTGTGTLHMVGRNGGLLPPINNANGSEFSGVTWGSFTNPLLNGVDSMCFSSSLGNTGGPGNTNVLLTMDSAGTMSKVARSADVAIINGAPGGGDAFFTSFSNTTLNDSGQIAFQCLLNGAGIFGGPGGNNQAIFGFDPAAGLSLIARTSDPFEVAPGDIRTIASFGGLTTSGGQDGRTHSLNAQGQFVFELDFTDGSSGIFVVQVPAPGAVPAFLVAGVIAARRRRR